MPLRIGVLQETSAHEARVALTPDVAAKFLELGAAIDMQSGAGERSHFPDALFNGVQFHAEPAAVLRERPDGGVGGLYTALTRATRALSVVHAEPLPEPLRGAQELRTVSG